MKLLEKAQAEIEERKQWLAHYEKVLDILQTLPPEIHALDCYWLSAIGDNEINLTFSGNDSLKTLKMAGCQGFVVKADSADIWDAKEGKMALANGITLNVRVWRVDKPPQCHVEAYTETITKYKTVCEKTGEEIK